MTTKTKTTRRRKLGPEVLKEIRTSPLPTKTERQYLDSIVPGFMIRVFRTGRVVYAVRFERKGPGSIRTLGDVAKWTDTETARTHARKLQTEYTKTGKVEKVERPDVEDKSKTRTTAEVLGLRERFAADGVEIEGLYRNKHRRGAKRATGNLEFTFDRFVVSVGPSTPFSSLTSTHVETWIATESKRINPRTGQKTRDKSLVRYLKVIRTAFRWAMAKKIDGVPLITHNPAKDVHVERTERKEDKSAEDRFLDDAEEAILMAALAARDERLRNDPKYFGPSRRRDGCVYVDQLTPLIVSALETGGRRGALFNWKWSDLENSPLHRIRFDGQFQKAGQTYFVPATKKLRAVLLAWKPKNAAPSDLIFPGLKGQVQTSTPRSWYTLLRKIALVGFRFHDNRHTFPSKLVQRGVPLKQVSVWLGHSSIRMTERYAHLDPDQGAEMIELLAVPLPKPVVEPAE